MVEKQKQNRSQRGTGGGGGKRIRKNAGNLLRLGCRRLGSYLIHINNYLIDRSPKHLLAYTSQILGLKLSSCAYCMLKFAYSKTCSEMGIITS